MSTEVIEVIHQHGSVRDYTSDPVPMSMVGMIVEAGQRASTSSNLQTYSVVAVTGDDKRERLAELCGRQQHIRVAPLFLAWCTDLQRLDRICRLTGRQQVTDYVENFLVSAMDVAIVMQNTALAAESLGLGICYIGAIRNNPEAIIDLLELPHLVFPVCGMTVGWPAKQPLIRPRLPLNEILHWERYEVDSSNQYLLNYDKAMIATGIYKGRQVPVPESEGEMRDYGWIEHSARRVSRPRREYLREILEKQGFGLR